jgi:FeS assembly SUF system protein
MINRESPAAGYPINQTPTVGRDLSPDCEAARRKEKEVDAMPEINEAEVIEALRECYDPEIPVNIVDLGLIYNIDVNSETCHVDVTMTLTALGCPMAGEVIAEVETRVGEVENVKSCKCELTFDPPWSPDRMTEDAKWELGMV